MIEELERGERHLAIDKIEPGLVYKIETTDDKCIFIQFLENREALDILTAERCEHIYPSLAGEYTINYSIITPFSKIRTIVTLPDKGYVPVVNLTTGAVEVATAEEYNSVITKIRDGKYPFDSKYPLILTELDHGEVILFGKKIGNLVMLTLPKKFQDDSGALRWRPTYKDEIGGVISGVTNFIKASETIKNIAKAYDIKRLEGNIDLEWYYYNWNTISEDEQKEVLAWVSVNDWGFKLANKINRLV